MASLLKRHNHKRSSLTVPALQALPQIPTVSEQHLDDDAYSYTSETGYERGLMGSGGVMAGSVPAATGGGSAIGAGGGGGVHHQPYSESFWGEGDRGYSVINQRLKDGKTTLRSLLDLITGRAQLEEDYGKKLIKISKSISIHTECGTIKESLATLSEELDKVARSHVEMATRLHMELETPVKDLIASQREFKHGIIALNERNLRAKQEHTQLVHKARDRYQAKCIEVNQLRSAHANAVQGGKEYDKIKSKLEKAHASLKTADHDYLKTTDSLADISHLWESEWRKALSKMENLDTQRLQTIGTVLKKFVKIVAAATVRPVLDGFEREMKRCIDEVSVQKDLGLFVSMCATGMEPPPVPQYVNLQNVTDRSDQRHSHATASPKHFSTSDTTTTTSATTAAGGAAVGGGGGGAAPDAGLGVAGFLKGLIKSGKSSSSAAASSGGRASSGAAAIQSLNGPAGVGVAVHSAEGAAGDTAAASGAVGGGRGTDGGDVREGPASRGISPSVGRAPHPYATYTGGGPPLVPTATTAGVSSKPAVASSSSSSSSAPATARVPGLAEGLAPGYTLANNLKTPATNPHAMPLPGGDISFAPETPYQHAADSHPPSSSKPIAGEEQLRPGTALAQKQGRGGHGHGDRASAVSQAPTNGGTEGRLPHNNDDGGRDAGSGEEEDEEEPQLMYQPMLDPSYPAIPLFTVRTKYDYQAQISDELDFDQGVVLKVLLTQEDGWWIAEDEQRRRGLIPSNFCEVLGKKTSG